MVINPCYSYNQNTSIIVIFSFLFFLFFFFSFLFFFFVFFFFLSESKSREYPWDIYSLKELLLATNNFHQDNKIGEGGFGSVYWGRTSKDTEVISKIITCLKNFKHYS